MPKPDRDNSHRRAWVLKNEGLYTWWTRTNLPLEKFVQDNREQIDRMIDTVVEKEARR